MEFLDFREKWKYSVVMHYGAIILIITENSEIFKLEIRTAIRT